MIYQQGDVIIERVDMPKGAEVPRGRVLATGEATGHAHRLARVDEVTNTGEVVAAADGLLVEVGGQLYLRVGAGGATITHEEHHPITVPAGDYVVRQVREYDHFAEEARVVRD